MLRGSWSNRSTGYRVERANPLGGPCLRVRERIFKCLPTVANQVLNAVEAYARLELRLQRVVPNVPKPVDLREDQVLPEFRLTVIVHDERESEPLEQRNQEAL